MKPKSNLPPLSKEQVQDSIRLLNEVSGYSGLKMKDDARESSQKIVELHTGPWKVISSFDAALQDGDIKTATSLAGDLLDAYPKEPWGHILFGKLALIKGRPDFSYSILEPYKESHDWDVTYCLERAFLADLAVYEEQATYYVLQLVKMKAWSVLELLKERLDCYRPPK